MVNEIAAAKQLDWPLFVSVDHVRAYVADVYTAGDRATDVVTEFVLDELTCRWPHSASCIIPVLMNRESDIFDLILEAQREA